MDTIEPFLLAPDHAIRVFRPYFADDPLPGATAHIIAQAILNALKGYRHRFLYAEILNEVPKELRAEYIELLKVVVPILHAQGLRVAGPSWGTGDYELEDWLAFRAAGWCGMDAIAVHCYWANEGFTPWHALRWLRFWEPGDPPILITECGRDILKHEVPDTPDNPEGVSGAGGWKLDGLSSEEYVAELVQYDKELQKHVFVLSAHVFTGGATSRWINYETDGLNMPPVEPIQPIQEEEEPMVDYIDMPGAVLCPEAIYREVEHIGVQYGVPHLLILALGYTESTWDPEATNKNEDETIDWGFLQINDYWWPVFKVQMYDNLSYNLAFGCDIMLKRYHQSQDWYDAVKPWTTRDRAWALYQQWAEMPEISPETLEARIVFLEEEVRQKNAAIAQALAHAQAIVAGLTATDSNDLRGV